jgi:Flp pilus assembly protein TadD
MQLVTSRAAPKAVRLNFLEFLSLLSSYADSCGLLNNHPCYKYSHRVFQMLRFAHTIVGFIVMALVCTSGLAQRDRDTWTAASPSNFEVAGQIRLVETGQPASKVSVRLERFGGGIVDQIDTDGTGRFRFPNLQRGYYKVIVSAPGFRQVQQDADLQVIFRQFLVFDLVRQDVKAIVTDVIDSKAPADAREELSRGRASLARKNHNEAITHLKRAISLYPDFFQAHFLLGAAYVDGREWKDAEAALQQALVLKPESPGAVLALGEVYWRQKRYDEAEKALIEGLKLDDKSWHGHFTLGRLYWDQGNIGKAAPAIGRTLQLKPDFAEAHLVAGNILLRLDQQERALVEYKEYLRLEPKGEFAQPTQDLVQKLSKAILENKKSIN